MERVEHIFVIVNIYLNVDSASGRVGSMVCEHDKIQPKKRQRKNKDNLTVNNLFLLDQLPSL